MTDRLKIQSWNELTEEVSGLPVAVGLALMSGRPELLDLAGKDGFDPDAARAVLNLLRVVMDTNLELQKHCQYLEDRAKQVVESVQGLMGSARRLHMAAGLHPEDEDDEV